MGDQPRELPTGDAPEPCSAPASFWDHWSPTDEMMESPQAEDFGGDQADVEPATALAPDAEDIRALRASVEPATAEAPHAEDIRALRASVEPATALAPDAEDIRALGASVEPATPPSVGAPPRAASGGHARFPVFESQIAPPAPVAAASDSQPRSRWTQDGLLADEWPSASEILAAHQAAQRTRPQPAARKRARSYELPTVAREPGRWVLPVWLAGPPFALFVLLCGSASCVLSVAWAGDSYSASIMTERLLSAKSGGPKRPLPEGVVPPEGTWVRTTAQHLAHWGFYQNALGDSDAGATAPDARALFERALEVSPINPTARLALAQLDQQEGTSVVPFGGLGLSRDVLSLASSARWLFAAGRKDTALQMYRKALEIASHRELSRYGAPAFSDDPAAPRYLLPGEDAVREILGTLVSQKDWTFAEWSQILPTDTIVPLVAARLLREESRQDAEELLELFLRADEHRTLERAAGPVLTAARAEAHALLSHWKEAEEEYHRAIELVDDDTVRRSWWFNLADIAFRLEDEGHRQAALRAALAVQTSDAISRRAADIQRSIGHRSRLRSIGAKAN